jgi:type II secretory pathway pseudopilin PulG
MNRKMRKMMKSKASQKGSAMLLSVIVALVIMGITGAYLAVSLINGKNTTNSMFANRALYAAEAGASAYIAGLNANVKTPTIPAPTPTTFPTSYNGATYSIQDTNPYLTNFRKLVVTGTYANINRTVEVILTGNPGGVYWNAIFAGNSSALNKALGAVNPYTLALTGGVDKISGQLVQDTVKGDIYSGGNFSATGAASLLGDTGAGTSTVTYAGTNTSTVTATYNAGTEPGLGIGKNGLGQTTWETDAALYRSGTRMDPNGVTYIDVAYDLNPLNGKSSYGTWSADGGSNATQITNQSEPSHIFRENPTSTNGVTDRTQTYEMTQHAKKDFYIEDPTTTSLGGLTTPPINGDGSATAINVQNNGNNAVYFIDGNLRASAEPIKSYKFNPIGTGPLKMTYVVKGNVSFTDNLLYPSFESKTDALAIIAVVDPAYPNTTSAHFDGGTGSLLPGGTVLPIGSGGMTIDQFVTQFNTTASNSGGRIARLDFTNPADFDRASQEYNKSYGSGNVYFGDPGSGTVEHFEAFMFAENNFYATNLDSTKSSGGTQKVEIYGNMTAGNEVKIQRNTTNAGYIPLHVTLDPIIKNGGSAPPALPSTPSYGSQPYIIASWRQIAS